MESVVYQRHKWLMKSIIGKDDGIEREIIQILKNFRSTNQPLVVIAIRSFRIDETQDLLNLWQEKSWFNRPRSEAAKHLCIG